jgi:hypothetical protein
VILLLALPLAAESVSLGLAVRDAEQGASDLLLATDRLGVSPQPWTPERIASAAATNRTAAAQLARGCGRLQNDPLVEGGTGIGLTAGSATAVLDLCRASVASSRALDDFIQVASAYRKAGADPGPPGARLLDMLSATRAPLEDAERALAPAVRSLRRDLSRPLEPHVRTKVEQAVTKLAGVEQPTALAAAMARYLGPAIGGGGHRASYLLLLENPGEMRPSGGLIGSVGTITFADGAPSELEIRPYDDFNPLFKQRFPVPAPLDELMTFYNGSLEIGDAGWDPDFPTTARLVEAMFASATGRTVDGTIALDPYAISALLTVTGPIDVAGFGSFRSDDLYARLNELVNARPDPHEGKQALPIVGREILRQVLAQPIGAWPALLDVFQAQVRSRHLQISLHDPALSQALSTSRADGRIATNPGDYLMVVDANVGATKGDLYVNKRLSLKTEVYPTGVTRHEVSLTYEMPSLTDDLARTLNPGDGTYRDYVRFYLPDGMALTGLKTGLDGPPQTPAPVTFDLAHGRMAVGTFFELPPGHRYQLALTYEVPTGSAREYGLYLQKQAGSPDLPTDLTISYPGRVISRQLDLKQDEEVRLRW